MACEKLMNRDKKSEEETFLPSSNFSCESSILIYILIFAITVNDSLETPIFYNEDRKSKKPNSFFYDQSEKY